MTTSMSESFYHDDKHIHCTGLWCRSERIRTWDVLEDTWSHIPVFHVAIQRVRVVSFLVVKKQCNLHAQIDCWWGTHRTAVTTWDIVRALTLEYWKRYTHVLDLETLWTIFYFVQIYQTAEEVGTKKYARTSTASYIRRRRKKTLQS